MHCRPWRRRERRARTSCNLSSQKGQTRRLCYPWGSHRVVVRLQWQGTGRCDAWRSRRDGVDVLMYKSYCGSLSYATREETGLVDAFEVERVCSGYSTESGSSCLLDWTLTRPDATLPSTPFGPTTLLATSQLLLSNAYIL
jgi:hypothetical protein